MIVELPQHLVSDEGKLAGLRRWANRLAGYYRLPIWLCGSALAESNPKPRDWDVRIEMPDDEFRLRFGDPEKWAVEGTTGEWTDVRWAWSRQCVKNTKEGWAWAQLNIDFQIYPVSHCEAAYKYRPKARLDTLDFSAETGTECDDSPTDTPADDTLAS